MSQPNPMHNRPAAATTGVKVPPDDHESIPLTEAAGRLVEQGVETARAGRRREAIKLFDQALAVNPDHVEALLWRGGLSEANESLPFLERALALDPGNQRAREGLEWARRRVGLSVRPQPAHTPQQRPAAPITAPITRTAPPAQTARPAVTVNRPAAPVPAAVIHRPAAARPSTMLASSIPLTRPAAPPLDIVGMTIRSVTFLVQHPTVALIVAIMLLGLLGTAAVARAGMSKPDPAPTPLVSTSMSSTGQSSAATQAQTSSRATTPVVSATTANAASLDQAWNANDWPLAILIIEEMLRRTPNDAALTSKLVTAYVNNGVQLVRSERLAEAVAAFDKALALNPNNADVLSERRFAKAYLDGTSALTGGDFASAITYLRFIYDGNPAYRAVKERLYRAYVGYAGALEKAGKPSDAYLAYQRATRIDAQGQEAQAGMTRLTSAAPAGAAAAAAAGKRIEVDLTKQQVIAWENNKLVFRIKASTGKDPYITRTGNFEILNKMDNAYSSAMEWGMPYWMGIYQAGGSEDGFHAMARLANGAVLSTSVLGKPYTRGCIMMGDYDAKALYNWAAVGVPVNIHE